VPLLALPFLFPTSVPLFLNRSH